MQRFIGAGVLGLAAALAGAAVGAVSYNKRVIFRSMRHV